MMPQWWDWDDVWGCLATGLTVALIALIFRVWTADHSIRFYYLKQAGVTSCVVGDIDWGDDVEAFCSGDPDKSAAMLQKLNSELQKSRAK